MTSFSHLKLSGFRNLADIDIYPGHQFNFVVGDNGSGKTSFLEALSLLSHGKSFRTHKFRSLIQHEQDRFTLFAKVEGAADYTGDEVPMGVERSRAGAFHIRFAGETLASASSLARHIPFLIVDSSSFAMVEGGPRQRREFFDWLVFHVKHQFSDTWRTLSRCYKQRNALLKKTNLKYEELAPWDKVIALRSRELQVMREEIFALFQNQIQCIVETLGKNVHFLGGLDLALSGGWRDEKDYLGQLEAAFERDRRYGYSTLGPHKADISFKIHNRSVSEVFSRGQTKLFICLLYVAKAKLLAQQVDKSCVFAVDDLPSELDRKNQQVFINWLTELGHQVFVTAIGDEECQQLQRLIEKDRQKTFHVKHGQINGESNPPIDGR